MNGMDDLVQFLRARLDEDESVARAVEDGSAPFDGQWKADGDTALRTENDHVLAYLPEGRPFKVGVLRHIARHDPARILREVEAKRRIVQEILKYEAKIDSEWGCCHLMNEIADGLCSERSPASIPALQLLAVSYADHPDYREEWRP